MSSTTNYIAWKERRDLEDGARAKIQAAAATEKSANTIPTQTIGKKVADLTGNRQAPDDLVENNRKLFDEVVDNAQLDEIRTSAPKLAEWLTQQQNYALAKGDLDNLLPVAKTIARIGEAPKVPPLWKTWPADNLSLPTAAALTPFGDNSANAVGPLRSVADEMASATERPAQGTGEAPVPAAPATLDNSSVRSEGAPVGAPTDWTSAVAPSVEGSGHISATVGVGAQANTSVGSAGVPGVAPSEGPTPAASAIKGSEQASMPAGAGAQVSVSSEAAGIPAAVPPDGTSVAASSIEGSGQASAFAGAVAQANVSVDAAEAPKATNDTLGFSTSFGDVPRTQVTEGGWSPSYNKGNAEREEVVKKILGVNKLSRKEYSALLKELLKQKYIDPQWAHQVAMALRHGAKSLDWAREALLPRTLDRQTIEAGKAFVRQSTEIVGESIEGIGQLGQAAEENTNNMNVLMQDISNANPGDYDELVYRIRHQNLLPHNRTEEILKERLSGEINSSEALKRLAPGDVLSKTLQNLGESLQKSSETMLPVAPGMQGSAGTVVGQVGAEIAAPVAVGALTGGTGTVIYGGVRSAGALTSEARKKGAPEDAQTKAAWIGLAIGLATSVPYTNKIVQNPAVKNALGRWGVLGFQVAGDGTENFVQQMFQNEAARSLYDPQRGLFDGGVKAFIIGAGASGVGNIGPKIVTSFLDHKALSRLSKLSVSAKENGKTSEVFRDFVATGTQNTPAENLHIKYRDFVKAAESVGADPKEVWSRLKGSSEIDFNTAAESGGDLRFRLSSYLTDLAGTKEGAALKRYARFDPSGMPWSEAEQYARGAWDKVREVSEKGKGWKPDDKADSSRAKEAPPSGGGQEQATSAPSDAHRAKEADSFGKSSVDPTANTEAEPLNTRNEQTQASDAKGVDTSSTKPVPIHR